MPITFESVEQIAAAVGQQLGESDWLTVTQERIQLFADAVGDQQWIHVDPERAREGPFGACIAHGYLTLALASYFMPRIVHIENLRMGVNYGCERVRFPAPVPVGSRIRGRGELTKAEPVDGGVQATIRMTIEIEGNTRPGCVVDTISRYYFH
ncbi:MaoC family dehydratase [Pseudoduganella namucuonensis]|uniref:Acyl dehydratase n=1 Tax=Pseudoduganella namucuonensis TaxID=1035707 RepID=A0A1I7LSE8_9BURK|nr:MaoC family dehydratase [Pseudoduganella namucuonensis]SFV12616.1 Acyl dehydratase [Pseudoduganella namucuonensis]